MLLQVGVERAMMVASLPLWSSLVWLLLWVASFLVMTLESQVKAALSLLFILFLKIHIDFVANFVCFLVFYFLFIWVCSI